MQRLIKYNLEDIGQQIEPFAPLILGFEGNRPVEVDTDGAVIYTLCTDIYINEDDPNNFIESKIQELEPQIILQCFRLHLN